MKLILSYIRHHLLTFLLAIAFLVLECVADLLQPAYMASIVDNGIAHADASLILRYGKRMLLIAALGAVGAVMRNLFSARTSQTIAMEMRGDLFAKVQTLSQANLDRLRPGSIITRITNDVSQIQTFVNGCMRIMIKTPITCVGAIVMLLALMPRELPLMLVIIALTALFIFLNMKIGYPRFGKMQTRLDDLNVTSREFLNQVRVVKAFRAEEEEAAKFDAASGALADAGTSANEVMAVFAPLISLVVNLGIVVILWTSRTENASVIGHLMASANYMTQMGMAFGKFSKILNTSVRASASAGRIQEIFDERPDLSERPDPVPLPPRAEGGRVAFRDVSFTYDGSPSPALTQISCLIRPGETLGIIGPTGAGKTTLVNLVPRFYDATEGTVCVDGVDVRDADPAALRQRISVVPQKALLFTGTIRENILWGKTEGPRPTADVEDPDLLRAIRISCADDVIRKCADGLDTQLGQGGVNLSGGQKQRVALARALIRSPEILILDDCTSALDAETEAAVLRNLTREAKHMTVLLISQKVSTVMRADRILCLENGAQAGLGTHEELLASCEAYRAICRSQLGDSLKGGA